MACRNRDAGAGNETGSDESKSSGTRPSGSGSRVSCVSELAAILVLLVCSVVF